MEIFCYLLIMARSHLQIKKIATPNKKLIDILVSSKKASRYSTLHSFLITIVQDFFDDSLSLHIAMI